MDHHIPDTTCPHCGHGLNGAMRKTDDDVPEPGNMAKCIRCGGWSVFDPKMQLRRATAKEIVEAADDEEFHLSNKAWDQMMEQMKRIN